MNKAPNNSYIIVREARYKTSPYRNITFVGWEPTRQAARESARAHAKRTHTLLANYYTALGHYEQDNLYPGESQLHLTQRERIEQ